MANNMTTPDLDAIEAPVAYQWLIPEVDRMQHLAIGEGQCPSADAASAVAELVQEYHTLTTALRAAQRESGLYFTGFDAARMYIVESPCDPDITGDQWKAYEQYKTACAKVDAYIHEQITAARGEGIDAAS